MPWFNKLKRKGIRTFTMKVTGHPDVIKNLWDYHLKFNNNVMACCRLLFSLRNGKLGSVDNHAHYQQMVDNIIKDNRSAEHYVNALHKHPFKSKHSSDLGYKWTDHDLRLFDKKPSYLEITATRTAAAKLSSHFALHAIWKEESLQRAEDRKVFEKNNPQFLKFYSKLRKFEIEAGQVTERAMRWKLYNQWLINSGVINWRDSDSLVKEESKADNVKYKKILELNPELEAFEDCRKLYRKILRNIRPPTYTEPHPIKHPAWLTWYGVGHPRFQIEPNESGEIQLSLNGFKDNLQVQSKLVGEFGNNGKTFRYKDKEYRLSYLQLIWKNRHGVPRPYITLPAEFDISIKKIDKKNRIICGIDLGFRTDATMVIIQKEELGKLKLLKVASLQKFNRRYIEGHIRTIRIANSNSAKLTKGASRKMRAHVKHSLVDWAKKLARSIVDFAKTNNADTICMESLGTLVPSLSNNRYLNRRYSLFVHGKIRDFTCLIATNEGIHYKEKHPAATSQVCSRCDRMGVRYSTYHGDISLSPTGKTFICTACGYVNNADVNAAINIARSDLDVEESFRRYWPIDAKVRKAEKLEVWAKVLDFKKSGKLVVN